MRREGLVGTIQNADPDDEHCLILYTHPDFRASAECLRDGAAYSVLSIRTRDSRAAGGDAYMLELRGVPTRVVLKPNSVIYTSGLGGTFPRGITIGTVIQQIATAEVWTRTYLVRPAVTPSRVTTVLVLTAQRVTQGTGNVWGATVNADSATKRIAAAGDSLVKQAALLQAQARQAALDSMKRATIDSVRRSLGAAPLPPLAADSAAARSGAQPAPTTTPAGAHSKRRHGATRLVSRRDSTRADTTRKPRP